MAAINKLIHERARLLIMSYLASNENKVISYNELLDKLEFTSGNLSVQLKKLKDAGYLEIKKTFKENKPYTTVSITQKGIKALNRYVEEMEGIIQSIKNKEGLES